MIPPPPAASAPVEAHAEVEPAARASLSEAVEPSTHLFADRMDAEDEVVPAMQPIVTPPPAMPAMQPSPAPVQAPKPTSTDSMLTSPSAQGAATPDAAVRSFYGYVLQGQFQDAVGLWSPRMRSAYPPAENINRRFAQTEALTLAQADVVSLDTAAGRATVAIRLSETVGSPGATRRYVGHWYLVRGPAGWLLDRPALQLG